MTQANVYEFFDLSIRYICQRVGAPEFGIIEHDELLAGIARANPQLHEKTRAFLDAYRNWFEFTDKLIREGRAASSNDADLHRLNELVRSRDETREQLKQAVAALPQRKFSKNFSEERLLKIKGLRRF